ncbi:MAG: glycine betaine/L-proline ABC transporter substrate-binding protein ProX [Cyanobacteria bacterium P01_A01_bin.114]
MKLNSKRLSASIVGLLLSLGVAGCRTNTPTSQSIVIRSAYAYLEELFQTEVVNIGLEQLGYEPVSGSELEYDLIHQAIARNYLDYTAVHWNPTHSTFYADNDGGRSMQQVGSVVEDALQGYLIDQATAAEYNITNLGQLRDPDLAKLFDLDGNGKANLVGCPAGWRCRDVIEHHLTAYQLRDTVEHDDDNYFADIETIIQKQEQGEPVLYFSWTPMWLNSVLVPDEDVVWLEVPRTSLPDGQTGETVVDDKNLGFPVNQLEILANQKFLAENPTAKRWFELVQIPINDVSAQNQRMRDGENTPEDVRRHAEEWIQNNQGTFDTWLADARKAK